MNTRKRWLCHNRIVLALATSALFFGGITSVVAQNGNAFGRGHDKEEHPLGGSPGLSGGGPPGHANQGNGKDPRGKDSLIVEAKTSIGDSVEPFSPGKASHNSRYVFCLPDGAGSPFSQTFPLEFTPTNENGNPEEMVEVTIDPVGRLAEQATVPDPFMLTDDGSLLMKDVSVGPTDPLEDGAYTLNLQIRATPARRVHRSHHIVRIHVLVGTACNGEEEELEEEQPVNGQNDPPQARNGFFTDSEFNLLQDCEQQDVVENSGGTFTIVTRPETNLITAPNPGTFYLNLIWPNMGGAETVTIELSATNLVPTGANAVHALVFDPNGIIGGKDNWDMVNEDGKPCGPDGPCTLEVDGGQTLWLTWHLVFAGTGQSADDISSVCEEGETVTATATLTGGRGELAATTLEATGHVKE